MIDLAEANTNLINDIFGEDLDKAGDIRKCYNCATCISGCPAAEGDPPLLIRRLVRKILLGLEDELLDDETPWSCVSCNCCEEMCPMGVHPFEVGLAIRRWQCREDETYIPPSLPELWETGHTQSVHKQGELRKSLGLADAPPSVVVTPGAMEGFQKMLKETDIVKSAPYMFKEEEE
ncbi:MAG: heterodisulfide reductase [bacterium]|nr:heterodisulfide reductase [bacterium]